MSVSYVIAFVNSTAAPDVQSFYQQYIVAMPCLVYIRLNDGKMLVNLYFTL